MSRPALALLLAALAAVLAIPARADGVPDLLRQYPERAPDGTVRIVAAWSDGTYSFLIRDYPERRPDGQAAKVYRWNNGRYTCVLQEYSELRGDGVYGVQLWCDASWKSWLISRIRGPTTAATLTRVIDGDTIEVSLGSELRRVRLFGVDAPEDGDKCFESAKRKLYTLLTARMELEAGPRNEDAYGRLLRYVYSAEGVFVDLELTRSGEARAWSLDGQLRDSLIASENHARAGGLGCLWRLSEVFTPPSGSAALLAYTTALETYYAAYRSLVGVVLDGEVQFLTALVDYMQTHAVTQRDSLLTAVRNQRPTLVGASSQLSALNTPRDALALSKMQIGAWELFVASLGSFERSLQNTDQDEWRWANAQLDEYEDWVRYDIALEEARFSDYLEWLRDLWNYLNR